MTGKDKPLRILAVLNGPWDLRLGASRVWSELSEQWTAAGHQVERYSLSEAFAGRHESRVNFALRQVLFPYRAASFIRKNSERFDVIDSLLGTIPFSKRRLRFKGLLVARSIGLYRLYEKFDQQVTRRPSERKGRIWGRVLYPFIKRRLLAASELAIQHADLVNLPNQEELECLRTEIRSDKAAIVQPYGLTEDRRSGLLDAASPSDLRLKHRRIVFVGMWSPRKGARDWLRLVTLIREGMPGASFRFVGTMVPPEVVLADLPPNCRNYVEIVPEYTADELPGLLADCTIGVFPSYVEGFGLAVLEQIAAGLPTVAYDIAGPRDVLNARLAQLLTPRGDIELMAAAVIALLQLDLPAYTELAAECAATARLFSWSKIAAETIRSYEGALWQLRAPKVIFVQPFSISSPGGGARILRALVNQAPLLWHSISTTPQRSQSSAHESHVGSRPYWGRIEHTRLALLPKATAALFSRRFAARLQAACQNLGAGAIHAVAHSGFDFVAAQIVARDLGVPFLLSVHDDLVYTAKGALSTRACHAAMEAAWKDADRRFVISHALGREYCDRYGERPYVVVTDGVSDLGRVSDLRDGTRLRIYFMGMFHMSYEANFAQLLQAISIYRRSHPDVNVTVTCRCEHIRPRVFENFHGVEVLPFGSERDVSEDIKNADLLYMPLPFGEQHSSFARYSLSTKMVTYLGSGVPILYHGPAASAAHALLAENDAALLVTELDAHPLSAALADCPEERRAAIAHNALGLARRQFMLADQVKTFWTEVLEELPKL